MVEKMKRLRLLMAAADSDGILKALQNLGVVHLDIAGVSDDRGLMDLERRITGLRKTADVLADFSAEPATDGTIDGESGSYESFRDAESLEAAVNALLADRTLHQAEAERCRKNLDALAPWGAFDAGRIAALAEAGLVISFHALTPKTFRETDFTGRHVEIVSEDKSRVLFVELRFPGEEGAPETSLYPSERLPEHGALEIQDRLTAEESAILDIESRLAALSTRAILLDEEAARLDTERERLMASLSLGEGAEGEVVWLSGYVPVSLLDALEEFLAERSILPLIEEPSEPAETPVRLKNGPVARLFEPITKIFGLPAYMEIDTTPFFAPFFAFFFGMCLADVGYGVIVTLAALAGIILLKAPAARSLAKLGFILGLMTVVGGLFLNTLFGMEIDGLPTLPPAVRTLLLFRNIDDAMAFSLFLGVVQILIGFIMQTVNRWRQDGFVAALQPIGTFTLIVGVAVWAVGNMGTGFAIGPLSVGAWIGSLGRTGLIGPFLAGGGVLLILFFNNPSKKIWIRPLLGLWEMYGIASGVPGDILSYIRLFALSLAGGLLGGAINLIAMMIRGDDPSFISWVFMLLVLVGGHAVNFALAALGAFVHPLRLTFVEFYKAVGFAGGGKSYAPYGGTAS